MRLGSSFGGGEPAVVAREPYVAAALEDQEDAISSATAADGDVSSELQRLLCRTVRSRTCLRCMLIELF